MSHSKRLLSDDSYSENTPNIIKKSQNISQSPIVETNENMIEKKEIRRPNNSYSFVWKHFKLIEVISYFLFIIIIFSYIIDNGPFLYFKLST